LKLQAEGPVPYELDGEMMGFLPLDFTLNREALRVLATTLVT